MVVAERFGERASTVRVPALKAEVDLLVAAFIDPRSSTLTNEQRVRFAILVARRVYFNPEWRRWADDWLTGSDRSRGAARLAGDAIRAAAQKRRRQPLTAQAGWMAAKAAWQLETQPERLNYWSTYAVQLAVKAWAQLVPTPLDLEAIARDVVM